LYSKVEEVERVERVERVEEIYSRAGAGMKSRLSYMRFVTECL